MFIGRPVIFADNSSEPMLRESCTPQLFGNGTYAAHACLDLASILNSEVQAWYRYHIYRSIITQGQGPASLLIVVFSAGGGYIYHLVISRKDYSLTNLFQESTSILAPCQAFPVLELNAVMQWPGGVGYRVIGARIASITSSHLKQQYQYIQVNTHRYLTSSVADYKSVLVLPKFEEKKLAPTIPNKCKIYLMVYLIDLIRYRRCLLIFLP